MSLFRTVYAHVRSPSTDRLGSLAALAAAASLCFATLAGPPAAAAASAAPPPPSAFGTLPQLSEVTLSPSGTLLAWAVDQGPKGKVVVAIDVASGATKQTFPLGAKGKLRDLTWHDDETLLVEVSIAHEVQGARRDKEKYEFFRTIAIGLDPASKPQMLLMDDNRTLVTGADMVAVRTATPKTVIMSTYDYSFTAENSTIDTRIGKGRRDTGWISKLFAVDVRDNSRKLIDTGTSFTREWLVDTAGRPVARSEWEPKTKTFRVVAKRGGSWSDVYALTNGSTLTLTALTQDGTAALAIGTAGDGRAKLWSIPLDGSGARVLVEDPNYDVEGVWQDRFDNRPISVWIGGPTGGRKWIDTQAEALHNKIARAFPGRQVSVYGRSKDDMRVLAHVSSPSHAPTYYLIDLQKRTADIVGEAYPALADVPLGTVEATSYAARDGAQIPAYVTLPPGRGDKNLPLVVMPHGGPEARDDYEFDYFVQFLATRGYAVLQPQFRGSTGFGDAHRLAGYGQWGGRMQDDVTDGVKALIAKGMVDPKRVCILGGSYGGYAALAGATFTPELYACAVSINGVSDLPAMLGEAKLGGDESWALNYWRDHIGSVHDPKVADRSPSRHADKVRAPILLLHGTSDSVVPITQSETMARELTKAGKPVTFVRLDGEDHWLSGGATRTKVLEEVDRFLAQHLPPALPVAATASGGAQ